MSELVLVVDDDPVQRRLLAGTLEKLGYKSIDADSGEKALDILRGKQSHKIAIVLLDLIMPEMDGMAVLEAMRAERIMLPVVVQTAQGGVDIAVNAMRAGASDFVVKPTAPQRLKVSLQNALKLGALEGELKRATRKTAGKLTIDEIISASPNMASVKKVAAKAAQSNIPVLIDGESGVGKEMIARAIQGMSNRSAKNFVTVNCGALPETLAESILFGHEKGAFTGASDKHTGKFQEANGGTLFLDEVGELSLDLQVKLLRAIQEGEIDPVGARKPVKVDFRLISATNRNLLEEVKAGNFREDLFYRLNVLPLTVPPLRERREDIPALLRHFVARIAAEEGRSQIKSIQPKTVDLLCEYDWPGNIRQLENAVFRAVVLCEGDELGVEEFPQIALATEGSVPQHCKSTPEQVSVTSPSSETPDVAEISADSAGQLDLFDESGNMICLAEAEKEIIKIAIDRYEGRMSKVARKLGIGRSTLYRKLKDYDLENYGDEPEVNA